jgi:hypothetical protein
MSECQHYDLSIAKLVSTLFSITESLSFLLQSHQIRSCKQTPLLVANIHNRFSGNCNNIHLEVAITHGV